MNNDQQKNERLFKQVFNNIVLFKNIYNHVRLYKKNEYVAFNERKELIEYKEREYIHRLSYKGDMLELGDLPIGCALKEVCFESGNLSAIPGDAIPYGVEILKYYAWDSYNSTTLLSTLPSTIHTVKNVSIRNATGSPDEIPPNITSISFKKCPNISSIDVSLENEYTYYTGCITIPNTIKTLIFDESDLGDQWNNQGIDLKKGDIPEGVTFLKIGNYKHIKNLTEGILPNSIKQLEISYEGGEENSFSNDLFNFIPPNVETFYINLDHPLTPESNLFKHKSIKKLTINGINYKIHANSFPPNLTDLTIVNIHREFEIGLIPNSVTNLKLFIIEGSTDGNWLSKGSIPNSVISLTMNLIPFTDHPNILPQSLTHLEINNNRKEYRSSFISNVHTRYTQLNLVNMISILPESLTSISLPKD